MPSFYLDERDVSTRDGLSFYSPFVVTDVIGKDRVNVTLDADLARTYLNVPSLPVLLSQLEDIDQYTFLARVNSGTGDVEEVQLSGSSRINLFPDTGPPPFISWDLVTGSVSNSYLANMSADRIKGRANGAGTGAPQDLTATQVRTILNVADGADNTTASNVGTAGVGVFKQKSGSDLQFKKLNAGSSKLSVTDDTGNDEVDLDVVEANINHDNLTGFVANEHVDHSAVTLTAGDGLSGGGDITASRSFAVNVDGSTIEIATDALQVKDLGITTAKIANDAVTYAKMQNVSATDRLLGRVSASAGDVEEVVCTDFAQSLLDDAAASDARTTLGLGALATGSSAADIAYTPAVLTDWDGDADPGDVDNALDQLAERIDDVEGAVGTGDFYDSVTDGTTTATASGGDTFKLRSASNLLTVAVQNNDATHGDNALFTVNQANIDHDALTNFVANEHVDHTAVTLTAGDGLSGGGDISASRSFAVNVDTTSIEINADTLRRTALTGDVTASAGSSATTIANDAVTNAKAANMAQSTIKGRAAAAGTGDPTDLTAAQVRTIINVADGATAYTDELAQDAVGGILADSSEIDFEYDDVIPEIVATIKSNSVGVGKLTATQTNVFFGRDTAGAGAGEEITASAARTILNVADGANNYVHPNHTGDVTSVADGATTIAAGAVTFAKIQNIATDRLLGRDTAGSGSPEEISLSTGLAFTGSGGIAVQNNTTTQKVEVHKNGTIVGTRKAINLIEGSNVTLTVTDDGVDDEVDVTIASSGGAGYTDEQAQDAVGAMVDTTLVYTDATPLLSRAALTGDVTAAEGSNATTIANDAVTFAKMANLATDRLIGRDTTGTGDPEALTVGGGVEFTGSGGIQRSALTGDVTASAGSNSTTIANNAVTTAKIADDNVTYAKIQDVSATDRLLGRVSASAGIIEEVVCTDFAQSLLDDAAASDARTTLGLGTIATVNSPVPIANGGTGQTSQTAAFDALAPTTTKGDIIVSNGSDNIRLGVGSNTQVLTADSAEASGLKWSSAGTGDVVGPASSGDNRIARFDGTTGKLLQNSSLAVDDSGNLTLTADAFLINRGAGGNTALELNCGTTASNYVAATAQASGSPALIAAKSTAAPSENVDLVLIGFNAGLVKANQDGTAREVATISGSQTLTNKTLTTPTIADFTNATHDHSDADDGGLIDASVITYTPTTATDWDADTDPGDVNDALDQLAERVDDLEAGGGSGDVVGPASAGDSNVALFDGTTGKLLKNSDLDYTSGVLDRPGAELGLGHTGNVAVDDGVHFVLGTTTGTKFGTGTTQKIGFYNATPIAQQSNGTDLKDALVNLGFLATGGAATNLDLDSGDLTCDDIVCDTIAVTGSADVQAIRTITGHDNAGYANIGGTIDVTGDSVSNSSTTETTLSEVNIGDRMLEVDGQGVYFAWVGTIQTSANNKRLRVKLGSTTIYDSGAQNPGSAIDFMLETWVIRTGAATQRCFTRLSTNVLTSFVFCDYATAAETLSTDPINLSFTGQGGASTEITKTMLIAKWHREA